MCGDRERKPGLHAARIPLHRGVDESFNPGKLQYFVELARNISTTHAKQRAVEIYIFATAEFGMEARSNFEQRAGTTPEAHLAGRWRGDLSYNLEKRALAR